MSWPRLGSAAVWGPRGLRRRSHLRGILCYHRSRIFYLSSYALLWGNPTYKCHFQVDVDISAARDGATGLHYAVTSMNVKYTANDKDVPQELVLMATHAE